MYLGDASDCLDISKSNMFQEMLIVALQVRQDFQKTPGHSSTWQSIDEAHVDRVIPDSLYMFLRFFFVFFFGGGGGRYD